ncbi:MAG: GH36-type glycosyl hydrolase domain-containing protein [Clostridia bacterium]
MMSAAYRRPASVYSRRPAWEAALESLIKTRLEQIESVQIHTPNENLDRLLNYGLKHQANMGSRWARVRHNGYRDLTSDCECFGAVNPRLAWERIKRVLSYQYSNGYAPRTFLDGEIRDNNFADNTVWLTFTVYTLVKEMGDLRLLDEEVAFNDGTVATVYDHIKRSVEFLWNFRGLHGLVKVWGGDWNDGLNAAGLKGRGVSVWLSIAWYRANSQFAEIAAWKGQSADEQAAKARGEEMRRIVDEFGWDGEYYLCAYTDEDEKLGSSSCQEGKIYLIPQLWSVLSGIAMDGKEQKAMAAVDRYLDTELGSLVSYPPYSTYYSNIGDMTQKPPGVHENGGVYLHPMAWKLAVECMLKRNEKVEADLDKILPFDKLCEPYVMCNSYFPQITGYRYRTAGQSWRTASGSWLLKSVLQFILGLQPELAGLRLDPCLPPLGRSAVLTGSSARRSITSRTARRAARREKPLRRLKSTGRSTIRISFPAKRGGSIKSTWCCDRGCLCSKEKSAGFLYGFGAFSLLASGVKI